MNEEETARDFNLELDRRLSGEKRAAFSPDPAVMGIADKLARADFSGDSAIKESLRERLVADSRGVNGFQAMARLFRRDIRWKAAAFAAAGILLALLPVMRVDLRRDIPVARKIAEGGPQSAAKVISQELPARAGAAVSFGIINAAEGFVEGIFRSIPMGRLEGVRLKQFPIETAAVQYPIISAAGREFSSETETGVTWETEGAVITLKSRITSPEELFRRRTL